MPIRHQCAGLHHALKPVIALGNRHIRKAEILLQDQQHFREGLGQRPLDGAVDRVLFLGLVRVEGLYRIDDIVAHHAGAVGGVFPVLLLKRANGAAIPFARGLRGAAPVAIAHVQHVVAEILEHGVRRLGAFEVGVAMFEEDVAPVFRTLALQVLEREYGQTMVVASANRIQNQPVADRHHAHSMEVSHGVEAVLVSRWLRRGLPTIAARMSAGWRP